MNQIYIILGAIMWRFLGKRVGMWYAHGAVSNSLRVSMVLTQLAFTSTKEGLRIASPKRQIVGQGIDTQLFCPGPRPPSDTLRLITVGRISPTKNIDTLLEAGAALRTAGVPFTFRIVGVAVTPAEVAYAAQVRSLSTELGLDDVVTWVGPVSQDQLPTELQQADVFIHDGATNSLDKTLLEAVLCGCVVVSSNPAYRAQSESFAPALLYPPQSAPALTTIVTRVAAMSSADRATLMQPIEDFVRSSYSVKNLVQNILNKY